MKHILKPLTYVLMLSGFISGCSNDNKTPVVTHTNSAKIAQLPTMIVGQNTAISEQGLDGALEAVNQTVLSAQTSGKIIALPVDIGSKVQAGQILVRLKDTEARAMVAQTTANISAAEANVVMADKNYQRILSVFQKQLIPAAQMDKATAERDAARAQLAAARASQNGSSEQMSYTQVQAPFTGVVTTRNVELGEAVTIGQPLLSIQGVGALRAVTDVPQQLADIVRTRQTAKVILNNGTVLNANKITVFPNADPITHTYKVRVDLPEISSSLHHGELVKIVFDVGSSSSLSIPVSALAWRGEISGVYTTDNTNTLQFRIIRLGRTLSDGRLEILAGLSSGDPVVIDAQAATVIVADHKTETNAHKGE